ncbi:hypothetical protein [Streptomyces sp. NPDC001307]|uniref:hypothetical protein n=1 Tax=Streptomyces sp. NPDC001307 TaxID=3364560 RepID=UPI0036CCF37D
MNLASAQAIRAANSAPLAWTNHGASGPPRRAPASGSTSSPGTSVDAFHAPGPQPGRDGSDAFTTPVSSCPAAVRGTG